MNQFSLSQYGAGYTCVRGLELPALLPDDNLKPQLAYLNWGPFADLLECRIGWRVTGATSNFYWVGEWWNAFIVTQYVAMDQLPDDLDGHNWICLMSRNSTYFAASLFIARTVAT